MSEFISVCPKCRQRILCDTAYAGQRVACPVCLQEITMPDASPASDRPHVPPAAASATQVVPPPPGAKRKFPVLAVGIGAGVLILAAGGGVMALQKGRSKADAAPAAVAPGTGPTATTTLGHGKNSDCRAIWTFDQNHGDFAPDDSGNGNNAVLTGPNATWTTAAKVGSHALSLSGSSYAEASGPVVNTADSFTVAVWVKLNSIKGFQTVLSIDGNQVSGFFLQFKTDAGDKFVFNRLSGDSYTAAQNFAAANDAATVGTWYHLAGVYDAAAQSITLYVNGQFQQTVLFTSAWQADGKTAIGRGFFIGRNTDFLDGVIDDARIYASVLSAKEIQALVNKGGLLKK